MVRKLIATLSLSSIVLVGSVFAAQISEKRAEELSAYVELTLPSAAGVHPLAILLPGCLSWHPHHELWREAMLERGYAVLHVDSFAARGLAGRSTLERLVCSGAQLHGDERAGDVMSVLASLRGRVDLNLARTVIFGWSHGGWTALEFLSRVPAAAPSNITTRTNLDGIEFLAAFIFYPYCGSGLLVGRDGYPQQTRTLVFHGSRDVVTNPRRCRARAAALAEAGATIEFISMQGSRHWFDNHTEAVTFDMAATARARAAIETVLVELGNYQSAP